MPVGETRCLLKSLAGRNDMLERLLQRNDGKREREREGEEIISISFSESPLFSGVKGDFYLL